MFLNAQISIACSGNRVAAKSIHSLQMYEIHHKKTTHEMQLFVHLSFRRSCHKQKACMHQQQKVFA